MTLDTGQAVTGGDGLDEFDIIDILDQLINKSLVAVDYTSQGKVRYRMLESIRQYAQQQLFVAGEGEAVRERHAEYFTSFGEQASIGVEGRDLLVWFNQIIQESDNLKAAREWVLDRRLDLALKMTGPSILVLRNWVYSQEGYEWLTHVVQQTRNLNEIEKNIDYQKGLAQAVTALGMAELGRGGLHKGTRGFGGRD